MTTTDTRGPHVPDDPARLNGWKEISAFLGKGVRTAQRWERTLKMPVHRIGHKGGEIVFAYRRELEEWLATAPFEAEPADEGASGNDGNGAPKAHPNGAPDGVNGGALTAPRHRRWLGVSMLGLLGVTMAVVAAIGTGGLSILSSPAARPPMRQPVSWKVAGDHLQTFDATGMLVWDHGFDFGLVDYTERDYLDLPANQAVIRDFDGDGAIETLFSAASRLGRQRHLYAFNSDGSVRFVDRPGGSATFGDTVYEPPWMSHRVFVGPKRNGSPAIWSVAIHGLWFPTRLRQLDGRGRLISEYWSNGYIETLGEHTWQERPMVFVGATHNQTAGASLAVFDHDEVAGSAPADDPRYRCHTCPSGGPGEFIVFPPGCLDRTGGDQAVVADVWPEGRNRLKVLVRHLAWPRPTAKPPEVRDVAYTLDARYRLVSVELPKDYLQLHARLAAQGVLDHPFGSDDERELGQAKRWNGTAFETMGPVAVSR